MQRHWCGRQGQCRGRQPVAWQAGDWTSIVYPSRVEETFLSLASEPTVSIKPDVKKNLSNVEKKEESPMWVTEMPLGTTAASPLADSGSRVTRRSTERFRHRTQLQLAGVLGLA
jgi:hypothetical protein